MVLLASPSSRRDWPTLLLGLFIAVIVAANIVWIKLDTSPPLWDMAGHAARSLVMADLIRGVHPNAILHYPTIYPPAVALWTGALHVMFGKHEDVPQLSLLLFVVVALLATYGLGVELLKNRWAAFFAAALLSIYPLYAHFTRTYDLDFPLTAMVAAALYALIKTGGFTHRRWSITFGLLFAVGALTKWTFIVFLVGPLVTVLARRGSWRQRAVNLTAALATALVLAGPWYTVHARQLFHSAEATRNNVFSVPTERLLSWENAWFYPKQLIRGLTWPLVVLATVGLILVLARRRRESLIPASWIILPYLIMTLGLYSKESRYLLPAFPALALLSAYAVWRIPPRLLRRGLAMLVMTFGATVWLETSWGTGLFAPSTYARWGLARAYGFTAITTERVGYGFTYPTQYGMAMKNIPTAIITDRQRRSDDASPVRVAVVPNSIFLNDDSVRYYGLLNGLPISTGLSGQLRSSRWRDVIGRADYLITKTGDQGPTPWRGHLDEIAIEEQQPDNPIFARFESLGQWPLIGIESKPQTLRLYRRR